MWEDVFFSPFKKFKSACTSALTTIWMVRTVSDNFIKSCFMATCSCACWYFRIQHITIGNPAIWAVCNGLWMCWINKYWPSKHGSSVRTCNWGNSYKTVRVETYSSSLWFSISLIFLSLSIISASVLETFFFASCRSRLILRYLKAAQNNE